MASCAYCDRTILFGGVRSGDLRFCNAKCQSRGQMAVLAAQVSESEARYRAIEIHAGRCPKCSGPGPVDIHRSYRVWSALLLTRWVSLPQLSCRSCGVRAQLGSLAFSAVLGWWGFPWGLLITPIQVVRNLAALASAPNPAEPSPRLMQAARLQLASRLQPAAAAATAQ